MILEGLVTTIGVNGSLNIAPMGPVIPDTDNGVSNLDRFDLKPFETSTTAANLAHSPRGVLHVTDDVEMIAAAATGVLESQAVQTVPAKKIEGRIIAGACRWYEFEVEFADQTSSRGLFKCRTVASGRARDFFGFNRAMHAVVEGAILATRVSFLPHKEIAEQFERLRVVVEKTGGPRERRAWKQLEDFVDHSRSSSRKS